MLVPASENQASLNSYSECSQASTKLILNYQLSIINSQRTLNPKPSTLNSITSMKINWKEILKLLITVLTAIAGTLGVVSCMS